MAGNTKSKDVVLVVPSIRENSWNRFVDEWRKIGLFDHVDVILMEDNPKKTFTADPSFVHLSWEDIERDLKGDSWIIPRRSDTVRSFGYYRAYQHGAKYILTLDDDCYPPTDEHDGFSYSSGARGFLDTHIAAMEGRSAWFNTLSGVKPRGIPFYNTGKMEGVLINHGLWTNVLDYDAPTQLVDPKKFEHPFDNRIVPQGQFFPLCGMNVMWKREATVLMYHLLMGSLKSDVMDAPAKLPFDRFGDIWCGLFAKQILDHNGYSVSTGIPYIHHDRASNPFTNLRKEANGLEVNEKLWNYVADFYPGAENNRSLNEQYAALGSWINAYNDFEEYLSYFMQLGLAMTIWSDLFKEIDGE